ncbi:MAG TPA: hypothetical protein DDZ51_10235 [Planctomycetaceae bacterium]|nr:hypothetical protein [Planctomycetaceae bacterium]
MTTVKTNRRPAMVLLVVLGMLTFFSILAATYLVFSNQSRESAFVIASRNTRAPDVKGLLDQALMKLIVGTNDVNDPFYGEDLLSDYYGRYDALSLQVRATPGVTCNLGSGFASLPIAIRGTNALPTNDAWDDVFTGRVITFLGGPLSDRSFRVVRSTASTGTPVIHSLVIELPGDLVASGALTAVPTEVEVRRLFFPNGNVNAVGFFLHMNGAPRNSVGIGFDGSAVTRTATAQMAPANGLGFTDLPRSLQPNHLGRVTSKMEVNGAGVPLNQQGDFDESYDAADFYNWFVSYRDTSGTEVKITPSFHRPAVINYILNQTGFTSDFANVNTRRSGLVSVARATFRPLPFAAIMLPPGPALNQRFTGSNTNYALRAPIDLINVTDENAARFRFDQVMKALIGAPGAWNPWDVDNDKDGIPDSIWIDLNLPMLLSQEGKMLKPLAAVQIEDLSARLNVNAHGNLELNHAETSGGIVGRSTWADSRANINAVANDKRVFRGVGYGPAEITIPAPAGANATVLTNLENIRIDRYQPGSRANLVAPAPGREVRDDLDIVVNGYRPPRHAIDSGYGYSTDPFGRAAAGLGRGGHVIFPNAGQNAAPPGSNEALNTPYESDPTGRLSGDRSYSFSDLEPLLRSNSFDVELLPQNLYGRLQGLMETFPDYENAFTTVSVSDDSLAIPSTGQTVGAPSDSAIRQLVELIIDGHGALTDVQINNLVTALIAPELRLGRKIDVNRRFGNGVDDNNNGVIDEPGELASENNRAFQPNAASGAVVPANFANQTPDYTFGSGVDGRQLLARHLYVLMMALTRDASFPSVDPGVPIDPGQMNLYRARRIAQWAVNVIDYRDPDSIMTRFVFDPNPFDGWNPNANNPAHIVWGVEQPELLFSESMAFHDVRVRDTSRDGSANSKSSMPPDPDTDQVRIPQGSLFLELYCPRVSLDSTDLGTANVDQRAKQAAPRELYAETTANDPRTMALQLNATAANQATGVPVWRLAISAPHPITGEQSPAAMRLANPSTTTFEPDSMDDLVPGTQITLERFVWFRTYPDAAALAAVTGLVPGMDVNNTFFAPNLPVNAQLSVLPGQYLSLAPRTSTRLGSIYFPGDAVDRPSPERFDVVPNEGVVYFNRVTPAGTRLTPSFGFAAANPFAAAKPIVIGTFAPGGGNWANALIDGFVGLNVSEPMPGSGNYYPLPSVSYDNGTDYLLNDAYVDLSQAGNTALDNPLDVTRGRIPTVPGTVPPAMPGDPQAQEPFLGAIPDYCTVFLQRLADPTQAFNVVTNPYRTVDWMTVDLNVFSGEETESRVTGVASDYLTRSRQRNGHGSGPLGLSTRNVLFSYETFDPELGQVDSVGIAGEPFFKFVGPQTHIRNSLSFLNTTFPIGPAGIGTINDTFDGFSPSIGMTRNLAMVTGVADGAPNVTNFDRNLPQVPFAQHPWLNRPFATPLELMMVPATSQARLFEEFSIPPEGVDPRVYSENLPNLTSANSVQRFFGPFRHLLNFFHGDSRGAPPGNANEQMKLADFSRIFDFVHTLPRFRGEIEAISPNRLTPAAITAMYQVPFNFKYDNRRQGRVNLNTVSDFPVWVGLMQGHLTPEEAQLKTSLRQLSYGNFLASRRGYSIPGVGVNNFNAGVTPNYDNSRFDPGVPTEFAAVYRGHHEAEFGPALRDPANKVLTRRSADATYMRRLDFLTNPNASAETSVFVRQINQVPVEPTSPAPPTNPGDPTVNAGDFSMSRLRNPYTRYQTAMRMPNLASDNSQTYVIRMTIGLFEVEPVTQSLGREYNEELGLNERYEAMFIIDRSRPVGFIPGQALNARDVVVFEKYYQ